MPGLTILVWMTPHSVYLPFNRDCRRGEFTPARGSQAPAPGGHWVIVQEQKLVVRRGENGLALPTGDAPPGLAATLEPPSCLGTLGGHTRLGGASAQGGRATARFDRRDAGADAGHPAA